MVTKRSQRHQAMGGLPGSALCLALYLLAATAGPAAAQNNQHCGDVSRNETWGSQDAHFVNCTVTIRNSKLVIAQGAQILMAQGASIIVASGSTLEIAGNADANEPVRILPNDREVQPGFWGQIRFQTGSVDSFIRYAFIQGGGSGGQAMIEAEAPVRLLRADLQKSGGPPVALQANIAGPSLDEAGQSVANRCGLLNLNPGSNGRDGIVIKAGDEADIVESQNWHDFCVPYLIEEDLWIGAPGGPTLTFTDGVEVRLGRNAELRAGIDEENPGQLEATGSPDRPVSLRGIEETPGSWRGLTFTAFNDPSGGSNSLYFTEISHGGSAERAMVQVHCPTLATLDVAFKHAPAYPLELLPSAVSDVTEGLAPVAAAAFEGNGQQRIKVLSAAVAPDLTENSTWKHPGVPLELDGDLSLRGQARDISLSLERGLQLRFPPRAALTVESGALLRVDASRASPVRLEGLTPEPGAWRGLRLLDGAKGADITGLDIGYGGAEGEPMVDWGQVPGLLNASTLHHALSYPLAIAAPRLEAASGEDQDDPGLRNRYQENGVERILVRTLLPLDERLVNLSDPGLPLEMEGSLTIASPVNTVVKLSGGLDLRFRGGQGLRVAGGEQRADLSFGPGRSGQPVKLGPLDAAAGWSGIKTGKGAALNGAGLLIRGPLAGGEALLDLDLGAAELSDLQLDGAERSAVGLRIGAGASLGLSQARVQGCATGILALAGASAMLERSTIAGNRDWGLRHLGQDQCLVARLIYWGSPNGPTDPSAARDGCLDRAYDGGGDKVSDHVQWWRYAIDDRYTPAGGLGPGLQRIFLPQLAAGIGRP